MRSSFAGALASVAMMAVSCGIAPALANSLPPVTTTLGVGVCDSVANTNTCIKNPAGPSQSSLTYTSPTGNATATASYSLNQAVSSSASASGAGYAYGAADIYYYIEILGPANGLHTSVNVSAVGTISAPVGWTPSSQGYDDVVFQVAGLIDAVCGNGNSAFCSGGSRYFANNTGFVVNQTLDLVTGVPYEILIEAQSGILQGTLSASVDPTFTFASDFNSTGYSIAFSDGITNATPIPATLPLFVSGLGALSLFGWRKKKKAGALAGGGFMKL